MRPGTQRETGRSLQVLVALSLFKLHVCWKQERGATSTSLPGLRGIGGWEHKLGSSLYAWDTGNDRGAVWGSPFGYPWPCRGTHRTGWAAAVSLREGTVSP